MLRDEKNLKDNLSPTLPLGEGEGWGVKVGSMSYTKTNKLISALYMVTDMIDKEEPIRLRLRTLGVNILSDVHHLELSSDVLDSQIKEIISFLNIACDIGMISEMNSSILRKEFRELRQTIQQNETQNHLWLEEFLAQGVNEGLPLPLNSISPNSSPLLVKERGNANSKGQGIRIGVQKGGTLLKALSQFEGKNDFNILKNKRREAIIAVIKDKKKTSGVDGVTITDIKNGVKDILISCGEKTLQRELVSMVSDKILYKTGLKRWSRYFIK